MEDSIVNFVKINKPMNQKTKQQIIEVIQKANKGIMDLKFGCGLMRVENDAYTSIIKFRPNNELEPFLINDWDCGWNEKDIRKTFKILGRPIRIEDILLAITLALPPSKQGHW